MYIHTACAALCHSDGVCVIVTVSEGDCSMCGQVVCSMGVSSEQSSTVAENSFNSLKDVSLPAQLGSLRNVLRHVRLQ